MAISVGRISRRDQAQAERFARYAARLAAFTAYAVSVAAALVLLAPVLFSADAAPVPAHPPAAARYVTVGAGEPLPVVAALNGVSVSRLLALNPELEPFTIEPGARVRIG